MAPPRATIPADPDKFSDAVKAFRRRVPVTSDEWDEMTAAEREYAFHVAHVTQANIVQDVFDSIDSAILNGDDFRTFKLAAGAKLEAAWGSPNAAHVETVFRSNTARAYSEGRQAIMKSPAVKKARPYWRFDAVGDNRTTDICQERDGVVKPQDDPWWQSNTPPLHHRCFAPGALITTLRGPVAIEDVAIGDMALTHRMRFRRVTELHRSPSPELLCEVALSGGGKLSGITANHPTLTDRGWVPAGELNPGDRITKAIKAASVNVLVHDSEDDEPALEEGLDPRRRNTRPDLGGLKDDSQVGQIVVSKIHRLAKLKRALELTAKALGLQPFTQRSFRASWLHAGLRVAARVSKKIGPSSRSGALHDTGIGKPPTIQELKGGGGSSCMRLLRVALTRISTFLVHAANDLAQALRRLPLPLVVAHPLHLDGFPSMSKSNAILAHQLGHRGRARIAEALHHLTRGQRSFIEPGDEGREPNAPTMGIKQATLNGPDRMPSTASHVEHFEAAFEAVELVRSFASATPTVFNITVEEDESYVAGGYVVHNCRSQLVPLTKEEADDEPDRPEPTTPAAGEFGVPIENPTDFEIDWDKFNPSIRNELERRLGKKKDAA